MRADRRTADTSAGGSSSRSATNATARTRRGCGPSRRWGSGLDGEDRPQAIAAIGVTLWDLKAKRAGLPLAKLLGAHRDSVRCYNTSGGFLHESIEQVKDNATRTLENGVGGIKIKVGLPDSAEDLRRVRAVREHLGDGVPFMVGANQQWDRPTAMRVSRRLEEFDLVWIEEPLDAYDAEGHAQLARSLDTAIATGPAGRGPRRRRRRAAPRSRRGRTPPGGG